jgi:hypothetical protein
MLACKVTNILLSSLVFVCVFSLLFIIARSLQLKAQD